MINKHKEFAESLRNIMRNEEKKRRVINQERRNENLDEESLSLQEMLEEKYNELFGPLDDDDD